MYKKIISLVAACAVLCCSLTGFGNEAELKELQELGIMVGFEDGKLHEDDPLTRAQAIAMILRADDFDDAKWYKSEISLFDDVPLSHWASGYVYKAASLGIVDGITGSIYAPEDEVTFEQAVKMVVCLLGYGEDTYKYPDDYIEKAAELGILQDVSDDGSFTRGDFAKLIYNALDCETADGEVLRNSLTYETDGDYYNYSSDWAYDDVEYAAAETSAMTAASGGGVGGGGGSAGGSSYVKRSASASGSSSYVTGDVSYYDDYYYGTNEQITPGQLTAGRWSDLENYAFWQELMQNQEYLELQRKWEIPIDLDKIPQDMDVSEDILDLMFTIDTTGSMGDELEYIKEELKDVVLRLDTNVRLSCNYYRDFGDEYVVKPFPFTTNVDKTVSQISAQYASGGGDYEEAVDLALLNSIDEHDWSESARSRLLFLVLDAPPHFTQEVTANIQTAVRSAVEKGIHIIPVASSGVDKNTEFFLRSLALATGGTYIFLTDDSGIGYSHLEPTIGEYEVEYLNELILKTIKEYIGQDYDIEPAPTQKPEATSEPEPTSEPVEETTAPVQN